MVSDDEFPSTQNKYRDDSPTDENSDVILNDILDLEEETRNKANFQMNFDFKSDRFSDISDFEEDNNLLIQASQEIEKTVSSERFSIPLQERNVQEFVMNSKPINTINKTRWAVSVFNSWKNARGWEGELLTMSNESLNLALKFFILEVRNKSGKEYYPNTIYELIISLQHYLRANKRFVSFLDDTEFNTMREVLDAKMKSLSKQGIGLTRRQADIISIDQENIMWQKGMLGTDSPKRLLDTLLYNMRNKYKTKN